MKDVKDNRKSTYKYTAGKKKTRENMALMLNVLGDPDKEHGKGEEMFRGRILSRCINT